MKINNYSINLNHPFDINVFLLNALYTPIIKDAVKLYISLYSEALKNSQVLISEESMVKQLGIDKQVFSDALSTLEAIKLVETYFQADKSIYEICVLPPLSWKEFVSNDCFKALLIRTTSQEQYEKLNFIFSTKKIKPNFQEVSTPTNYLLSKYELKAIPHVTQEIYDTVSKQTGTSVIIDKETKENALNLKEQFGLEQAAAIVADAAIPVINTKIALANNVETQADDCVLQNTYHSDKAIYRNPEIFKNTSLTEEVEKVFTAYESNNCYDYLASTLNVKLTDEMIKTLSKSRTHNKVSDDKINLMTDFTLIRTGNFSIVYFEKLLTTVVSKNFSSKNEMLEWYRESLNRTKTYKPANNFRTNNINKY